MRKTFVAALVAAFMVVGLVAYGTNVATDVPNDHTFHDDITWMFENDISRGCNPPQNNAYCPEDFVTRGQMSAFFHRYHNMFGGGEGQGPQGPQGPPGTDGKDGTDGLDGQDGVSGYEVIREIGEDLTVGRSNAVVAECPPGKVVIGGGYDVIEGDWLNAVTASGPRFNGESVYSAGFSENPNQWDVRVNPSDARLRVSVHAICATVGE